MDAFDWEDDDQLMAELGAAVRGGRSVPETFLAAGHAAFGWRDIDAELAELVADSAAPRAELAGAGMRAGASAPRSLSFAAGALSLELEVHPDALRGQLVPPQPGSVRVGSADDPPGDTAFPVDDIGWFVISPRPTGPIRLHVRTAGGAALRTEQFTV